MRPDPLAASVDGAEQQARQEAAAARSAIVAPVTLRGRVGGLLVLYARVQETFEDAETRLIERVARAISPLAVRGTRGPACPARLTDAVTGLPNGRFLRMMVGQRLAGRGHAALGFGLVALRIGEIHDERIFIRVARRLAQACESGETVVRHGIEDFLVLTPIHQARELVERWHSLVRCLEQPLTLDGRPRRLRVHAAHVSFPADGSDLDTMLDVLDTRLALVDQKRLTILPFRPARSAG